MPVIDDLDRRVTDLVGIIVGRPALGVAFTDVSRLLERHPDVFRALVDRLCDHYAANVPGVIMPIEARGFVYAGRWRPGSARVSSWLVRVHAFRVRS